MRLARKPHGAGDSIRYEIDYSNWLAEGDTLSATPGDCTVVLTGTTSATADQLQVMSQHLYFFVNGGEVSEIFTVTVTIQDSRGETAIDTVDFFVIAP